MNNTQSTEDSLFVLVAEAKTYLHPNTNGFPRGIAGEILQHVGRHGDYGGVVSGITPFLIGIAIQRIVQNYTEGDEWKIEFLSCPAYQYNLVDCPLRYMCPIGVEQK